MPKQNQQPDLNTFGIGLLPLILGQKIKPIEPSLQEGKWAI